jgi:hypothetical protein
MTNNTKNFRFIFGVGRSGTSWLAKVLAKTDTPIRYFHEILFHISPKIPLSENYDHTSINYTPDINMEHILARKYIETLLKDKDWSKTLSKLSPVVRNDKDFNFVLHKEVHALLATEGLIKLFNCPVILITRNPIKVIDSLLFAQGYDTIYLVNEVRYVSDIIKNGVLEYLDNRKIESVLNRLENESFESKHSAVIFKKIITVDIINKIFRQLAKIYDNVKLINYEDLLIEPWPIFKECARFFNFEVGNNMYEYYRTLSSKEEYDNPYSLKRIRKNQIQKNLKIIKPYEERYILELLNEL